MSLLYVGDLTAASDDTPRDTISDTPTGAPAVASEAPTTANRSEYYNVPTGGLQPVAVSSFVIPRETAVMPTGEDSLSAMSRQDQSNPDKGLTAQRIAAGTYGHGTLPIVIGIEAAAPHAPFGDTYFAAERKGLARGSAETTGPRVTGTPTDVGALHATRQAMDDARASAYRAFLDI